MKLKKLDWLQNSNNLQEAKNILNNKAMINNNYKPISKIKNNAPAIIHTEWYEKSKKILKDLVSNFYKKRN